MTDPQILESHGLNSANLEKWLKGDPKFWTSAGTELGEEEKSAAEKRAAMQHRHRSRVQEGMARNLADYKPFYVLDQVWDQPFKQINPALLLSLKDSNPTEEAIYNQFKSWGLSDFVTEEKDKEGKVVKRRVNLPAFIEVLVPLVRSVVIIRWAKIVSDLQDYFFKYDPIKQTTPLRVKCETITDRVQLMANQCGWFDVAKQAILKMLHYSYCFQFPKEEWWSVEQLKSADENDVALGRKNLKGEPASVGEEITTISAEGLRYHLPHPTRTYWDMAHGKDTYNYGTGCEFAGYWRICRYSDIVNGNYWNKNAVSFGTADLISGNSLFFSTAYSACKLSIPVYQAPATPTGEAASLVAEVGLGISSSDREKQIATQYYGSNQMDSGVLVTEHWERLIPKENGLGTYPHPVWFRFVMAGDGATYLYAAPVPYDPVLYMGYDADESRSKNTSLSMEVLPFEHLVSNLLTQMILTAKQNLANLTLLDEDQLTVDSMNRIKNIGTDLYVGLNVLGYSAKKAFRGQNRVAEAVQSFNIPKGNVAELIACLRTVLDLLQRILVLSSSEIAQAATHELRADEARDISTSSSTRLSFTSIPVKIHHDAWKRQAYEALMANGDDDFYVHLPSDIPLAPDVLSAMGFTTVDQPEAVSPLDRNRTFRVKKDRTAIDLWQFASSRDTEGRISNTKAAVAMAQLLQPLLANPMTAQAIGPDQALEITNYIARLADAPRDFRLRNIAPGLSEEQRKMEAQQQLQQVVDMVIHKALPTELKPLLDEVAKNTADVQQLAKILQSMGAPVQLEPRPAPPVEAQPQSQSQPQPAAPAGP